MVIEKQRTRVIVTAILLAMILGISTGQAIPVPVYPEPVLAWHNPTLFDVTDVAVGDLTGNGVSDVAYVDLPGVATLTVVYGINGTEYWSDINVSGFSIAVGDVDGDGKNEVIAGGWNDNEKKPGITVFEDEGTFKFFYETYSEVIKDIELGDVDNDGVADIVTCNVNAQGRIYAINGTEGGNLPGWPQVPSVEPIEDLALGNLDGNPGLDIAAISRYIIPWGTLFVYNSTGALMWSNWTVYGRSVEIGNVDSDPEEEVVIGDWNSSNVYVYNGSTGMLEYSFDTIHPPTEVELGDLDDDPNDVEIAVITGILEDATLFALDINATGQVNELWNFSIDWTPDYYGEGLAIGDVDGDNKNEVIALSDSDDYRGGFKVWAFDGLDGNGDGVGDVVWMYELSSHPEDVEVGDIDGDGDMDVLVGTAERDSVYALFTKELAPVEQPCIEIEKRINGADYVTAAPGDTLEITLWINNCGDVNLTNLSVRDNFPLMQSNAGLSFTGTSIPVADGALSGINETGWIDFDLLWWGNDPTVPGHLLQFEPLEPGEHFTITFEVTVDELADGAYENCATVTASYASAANANNAENNFNHVVSDTDCGTVFVAPPVVPEVPEVPILTPVGLIALVSALSAIAAFAIVRKRR